MGTKGTWIRKEAAPGLHSDGYDAIDWSATREPDRSRKDDQALADAMRAENLARAITNTEQDAKDG